jgi:hypothetical protein
MSVAREAKAYIGAGAWKRTFIDCVTPTPLMPWMRPSTARGVLQQLSAPPVISSFDQRIRRPTLLVYQISHTAPMKHLGAIQHIYCIRRYSVDEIILKGIQAYPRFVTTISAMVVASNLPCLSNFLFTFTSTNLTAFPTLYPKLSSSPTP